jgi:heat shock protein HtpX
MTVASLPRIVGRQLFYAEGNEYFLWFFLWPFGLALYAWGSLLTLAISRYREYIADRGASLVTGRPAALMSALQKLSAEIERIPDEDLRSARRLNPLLIVSARPERFALVRDHPPLAKRLARLASIARQMGRRV